MNYFTIVPPRQLANYVRSFWVLEGEASSENPYTHHSMADGCAELLFHYSGVFTELISDGKNEKSFVSGLAAQSQVVRRFTINQNFGMFGVYLYPFTASQFFGVPATILKNEMPCLQILLGKEANDLEEKIMLAANNNQRVNILTAYLDSKIAGVKKQPPGVFETIQHIINTNGVINVEELAKSNFLSTRQFERNFARFAGFNPKLFSRIIRFQATLNQYGNSEKSLTDIAYETGYYDQSHFIQDFKAFSGFNPRAYFSGNTDATLWRD